MLTYFSGTVHETAPSQASINKNKFSNKILRTRGKSQSGSRRKRLKTAVHNKARLPFESETNKLSM